LGDTYGYFSSAPLRGKKGTCYEGGMRVPFIASWANVGKTNPFKIARNHLHHEQIGTVMDIFSTIVDASKSSSPAKHPIDGVSLLPQLSGVTRKGLITLCVISPIRTGAPISPHFARQTGK
jgi:arylsulfatase A-like enzyme